AAFLVLDAERLERFLQAEPCQFAHRVWQQGNADPELLDLGHRLIHSAVEAALPQIEREAEPDDAAADDGNLHPSSPSGCAAIVNARFDEDKPDGITSGGLTIRNKPCTMAHPERIVLTLSAYRGCTGIDRAAPLIPLLCRCFVRCYLA